MVIGFKKLFFRVGYTNYNNRCPTDVVTECKPYSRGEPNELYEVQIKSRNVLEHYGLHE